MLCPSCLHTRARNTVRAHTFISRTSITYYMYSIALRYQYCTSKYHKDDTETIYYVALLIGGFFLNMKHKHYIFLTGIIWNIIVLVTCVCTAQTPHISNSWSFIPVSEFSKTNVATSRKIFWKHASLSTSQNLRHLPVCVACTPCDAVRWGSSYPQIFGANFVKINFFFDVI